MDGCRNELGGIERDVEFYVLRETGRERRHFLLYGLLNLKRVCAGRLEDAYAGGRLLVE